LRADVRCGRRAHEPRDDADAPPNRGHLRHSFLTVRNPVESSVYSVSHQPGGSAPAGELAGAAAEAVLGARGGRGTGRFGVGLGLGRGGAGGEPIGGGGFGAGTGSGSRSVSGDFAETMIAAEGFGEGASAVVRALGDPEFIRLRRITPPPTRIAITAAM